MRSNQPLTTQSAPASHSMLGRFAFISLIPKIMTGLGDIIILIVVFRLIFGLLGAWWEGENRNDFRRDR